MYLEGTERMLSSASYKLLQKVDLPAYFKLTHCTFQKAQKCYEMYHSIFLSLPFIKRGQRHQERCASNKDGKRKANVIKSIATSSQPQVKGFSLQNQRMFLSLSAKTKINK